MSRPTTAALVLFVLALATRLAMLAASPDRAWPHSVFYEGDAPLWVRFASCLQRGEPFEFNLPVHTPGMAYLLSWTWGGDASTGFLAQKVLLSIMGAASCVLVWHAARSQFGPRVGWLAGLLSAGAFGLTVQSTSLNNETPYTLLCLLIVVLTLPAAARPRLRLLVPLGLLHGAAVLFRAEHALLALLLCGYLAWSWRVRTASPASVAPTPRSFLPSLAGFGRRLAGQASAASGARRSGSALQNSNSPVCSPALDSAAQDKTPVRRVLQRTAGSANPRDEQDGLRSRAHPDGSILAGLAVILAGVFVVTLPWNVRSYYAIKRFNTVELRPVDYARSRVPWSRDAVDFIRGMPAFAREGNFRLLDDLAVRQGVAEVRRGFVEDWFRDEAGYVPRPLSPFVFVTNQGPMSFALANSAAATGGFSATLLDPESPTPVRLAFGNPRHLRLYQDGYGIGLRYLFEHPRDAAMLMGRKLRCFAAGLTLGLTPFNWPLGLDGIRPPVDQLTSPPSRALPWSILLLGFGIAGAVACMRRRNGAVWLLIVVYKLLVALAFYGYARQAASILPAFFVLVALGFEAMLIAPVSHRWPRVLSAIRPLALAVAAALLLGAGVAVGSSFQYDVAGSTDTAPFWGDGAFESCRRLTIRTTW